ncbi:MAG: phosphotransferase, partial [Spirochaetota bacterium]
DADVVHRTAEAHAEIQFYLERKDSYSILETLREQGELPCRVCHNDTKISNILLDEHSGEGIAVIDLDTVMPGTILYDFGDLGRTSLSNSTEDEVELGRIHARMEYFQAMAHGFLQEWGDDLSDIEVKLLAFAPRVMTLIIGLRFLTDYLNGDIYFQTHRAQHNLDRTRSHIALVKSMEQQEQKMKQLVMDVVAQLELRYTIFS